MSFTGSHKHPKSFSRFMRLVLYVGIGVVFIAPSKPWMNGMIEEFNKGFDGTIGIFSEITGFLDSAGFDKRFWKKDRFRDLNDIRRESPEFFLKRKQIQRVEA